MNEQSFNEILEKKDYVTHINHFILYRYKDKNQDELHVAFYLFTGDRKINVEIESRTYEGFIKELKEKVIEKINSYIKEIEEKLDKGEFYIIWKKN